MPQRLAITLVTLAALALPSPTLAGLWRTYINPRFGYSIALPQGFGMPAPAENGDGMTLTSTEGTDTLHIFGATIGEDNFTAEIKTRMAAAEKDGWLLTYRAVSGHAASFSGTRANRILYVRGIPLCDGAAAYFELEYAQAEAEHFDGIVGWMVKSLQPANACAPLPASR